VKLELRNTSGAVIDSVEVRDDVFGAPPNPSLVHQVMVGQLANRRQGTSSTKTRSQVSGGGMKPRPQKYTGRARQGSIRAPQWKGGGIVFGPAPRSYRQRTPRQMRRESIKVMLSDKVRERQLVVLDALELAQPKTKEMIKVLDMLNAGPSALLVGDGASPEVLRAARNIPRLRTLPAALLNTVDLLNARKVVMTQDAVRRIEELWGGPFVRKTSRAALIPTAVAEESGQGNDSEDSAES
jgi:large subunit ribosomal protein L4